MQKRGKGKFCNPCAYMTAAATSNAFFLKAETGQTQYRQGR